MMSGLFISKAISKPPFIFLITKRLAVLVSKIINYARAINNVVIKQVHVKRRGSDRGCLRYSI